MGDQTEKDAKILDLIGLHLSYEALSAAGVSAEEVEELLDRAARAIGVKEKSGRSSRKGKTTLIQVEINEKCPKLVMNIDGASKGNPGHSGVGIVLSDGETDLVDHAEYIGHATNNVAEYSALIKGLRLAEGFHPGRLIVKSDSELVVKQIKGAYRVKSDDLVPLYQEALDLFTRFASWDIEYIPRKANKTADRLATEAIKKHLKNGEK